MPTAPGFRLRDLDLYAEFLDSSPAEQARSMTSVHPDEVAFFGKLLISRAEFEAAEERGNVQ